MTTTISRKIKQLEERIGRIKAQIGELGPMRPGSISRQYRNPKERKTPYHQISYTHRMKSRTEYLRAENLKASSPRRCTSPWRPRCSSGTACTGRRPGPSRP